MDETKVTRVSADSRHMFFEQDGQPNVSSYTFYRGDSTRFYPQDRSFDDPGIIAQHFMHGLAPPAPMIDRDASIVAFGSCFAGYISAYLEALGYDVATRKKRVAYVSKMGEGIVNTYAVRQQFEWAWEHKQPAVELWHGYDAKALGYDEGVRSDTQALVDGADVFIITLGLSEVWYDEPTGEVFWRAIPAQHFDASRHRFRVTTHRENLDNLSAIHALIRRHRPGAVIVFTLSPIPLKATFRPMAATAADGASKAILRSALDEFLSSNRNDTSLYYFPSYEIATRIFTCPYMEDRRHIHKHVLDLNMAVFERYYCRTGLTDADIVRRFHHSRELDRTVVRAGHWAVPRINLARSREPGSRAEPRK